jgi:glycosyltransferase involved in cell wall biosynthesis
VKLRRQRPPDAGIFHGKSVDEVWGNPEHRHQVEQILADYYAMKNSWTWRFSAPVRSLSAAFYRWLSMIGLARAAPKTQSSGTGHSRYEPDPDTGHVNGQKAAITQLRLREHLAEQLFAMKDLDHALTQWSGRDLQAINIVEPHKELPRYFSAYASLVHSFANPYACMIFVPWLSCGGSDLVAVHALRAAQLHYGQDSVLMVVTDSADLSARSWLPCGSHIRVISDYGEEIASEDRVEIVKHLIHQFRPRSVLNVNSRSCWDVYRNYGRALSTRTELHAMFFCYDYLPDGRIHGYIVEYLRDCFAFLAGAYSDNHAIWEELARQYGLSASFQDKCHTLYQPAECPVPLATPPHRSPRRIENSLKVFWAGRLCQQKNPSLVMAIARQCPDIRFDLYGGGDLSFCEALKMKSPPNVCFMGSFEHFEQIPVANYDAYLYTSLWDGLPNVLIKAGFLRLPVVASGLDGIIELIDETTGWPIKAYLEPDGYTAALREVMGSPVLANQKADALYARIEQRHSWTGYMRELLTKPSFLLPIEEVQ